MSELPLLQIAPPATGNPFPAASLTREQYGQLAAQVKLLSWLSLAWMTIEGAVAIAAGIVASSIALVAFGLDSVIEGVASVIIVWRFTGQRVFSHAAEQRAQKLVAAQFFHPRPLRRVRIRQDACRGRASRCQLGRHRSVDRLGHLHAVARHRQAAPQHALRLPRRRSAHRPARQRARWSVVAGPDRRAADRRRRRKEGAEAWRGEGCCVSSPLDGVGFTDDACHDECCR